MKDIKAGENIVSSSWSWKIEEAKVFWFQGEQETAMRQLKQINFALKVRFSCLMILPRRARTGQGKPKSHFSISKSRPGNPGNLALVMESHGKLNGVSSIYQSVITKSVNAASIFKKNMKKV